MYEENIERIFYDDCREKKRTGNGVHHRALRLRKHEHVVFANLNQFDNKRIRGAGVIRIMTIKEMEIMDIMEEISKGIIPNTEEIDKLEFDIAQKVIAELRRLYSSKELQQAWSNMASNNKLNDYCLKYQVAKDRSKNVFVGEEALKYASRFKNNKNHLDEIKEVVIDQEVEVNEQYEEISKDPEIIIKEQYSFMNLKKIYTAQQLINFLERLTLFINEDSKYEIDIILKEIE